MENTGKSKKIGIVIAILLVLGMCLDCGYYAYTHINGPIANPFRLEKVSNTTVGDILRTQSNLITASYIYTSSENYASSSYVKNWRIPFTTSQVRFTYSGTINIGFDMSELETLEVDNNKKEIKIKLPKVQFVSCEIDPSSYYYDYETYSIFNSFTMDDVTDTLDQLEQKMMNKAEADQEFMDSANERGKKIIEELLLKSEKTDDYSIVWV